MRPFVSRGGTKLDGALDALAIDVGGARALDAGAATGGFTDCLLRRGAREVVAVDVAYGELAWALRNDPRVVVLERTNIRTMEPAAVGEPVDLVVADLSFISLAVVAGVLLAVTAPDGRLVLMVKPQFELPRARVPRGGVVREPAAWLEAMGSVAAAFRARGCVLAGATPSPITGPKGNREFFLHMLRGGTDAGDEVLARAIEEAP
jgi:23S rRNA (cytidine1920-2'-O)/16S rRNA (cytidine1409-2'-O)-methyltransferase